MQSLAGRTAVITGGARGIGQGIAAVLAGEGARVVVADLDGDAAEATAAELRDGGHQAVAVQVDVTERAGVEAMAAAAGEAFGGVEIMCANAGIYPPLGIAEIGDGDWDRVMDVNAKGVLHAVQACLPGMIEAGYGRIVITSSITGPITGQTGFAHYGASKAALLGLMRSAAVELAPRGVTVNAVMPGNVRTPGLDDTGEEHRRRMLAAIPMGYFADPADVGWAVRYLASEEARYVTGQTIVVDGGQVLPEGPDDAG